MFSQHIEYLYLQMYCFSYIIQKHGANLSLIRPVYA